MKEDEMSEILDVRDNYLIVRAPDGNIQKLSRKSLPREFRSDIFWRTLQEHFLTHLMDGHQVS